MPATSVDARATAAACSPARRAAVDPTSGTAKKPQLLPISARTPTPARSSRSSASTTPLRALIASVRISMTRASAYVAPAVRAASTACVAMSSMAPSLSRSAGCFRTRRRRHTRSVELLGAVILGLVGAWLLLLLTLWLIRPRDVSAGEVLRVVPDVLRLARSLIADPASPTGVRVALVIMLVWLISPIDLVPGVHPRPRPGRRRDRDRRGAAVRPATSRAGDAAPPLARHGRRLPGPDVAGGPRLTSRTAPPISRSRRARSRCRRGRHRGRHPRAPPRSRRAPAGPTTASSRGPPPAGGSRRGRLRRRRWPART